MTTKHGFTAITSEGGLLPTDFLAELANPKSDIDGLDPVTYRLAPGERIGEQVNRSWNRLKGCWTNFQRSIATKQPGESTTTETRERWLLPFFHELDFGRLAIAKAVEIDGKSYPVSHGWASVPIHLVGSHVDLDRRTPGAVGAARMSPHSLVQQVLNASEERMWGIISNGFTLRLLRDNVTLTRMAYVEWDLQALFDGDLYPEFFLLWLVCHQSRFEVPAGGRPDQCWLEKWKKQAGDKGLRALENLRPGVEKAIAELGAGLVSHKANQGLRSKLSKGQLTTQNFYRQILRVIYRMLFLFVAEDRGLLYPPLPGDEAGKDAIGAALNARSRYRDFYSVGRLRDLTLHRAGTPHPDLWQVFQLVSSKLGSDTGCPDLALPALGSFLWSQEATPDLTACLVSNRHFLQAVHSLAYVRDGNVRRTIDYKNLGSEELGSVYESLLELHPIVNGDAGTFELQTAAGHERKTTGSYYTHDSLVQCLLDSALEPVIAETVKGKEGPAAADALLKLKFCDTAVGSGHFLIAAGHRLAKRVAAARTGEEEPSPEAVRTALRDVIGRCLYGVDINPMAAELCRVNLWLEALEPGKPLSFLDHHIRVGNSLLGATPELIAKGIPDDAFRPIEGDDKRACTVLKNRNRTERRGLGSLFSQQDAETQTRLQQAAAALEDLPDERPGDIRAKELVFRRHEQTDEYRQKKQLADAWCAAFVSRKYFREPGRESSASGITQGHLNDLVSGRPLSTELDTEVERLSRQYQFFHWHLAFPEVFAKGGFDVNLGNPPWEKVATREKEFFASNSDVAKETRSNRRKAIITDLAISQPLVFAAWRDQQRKDDAIMHFLGGSGRFPLSAVGELNLYPIFIECSRSLVRSRGIVGMIIKSGMLTSPTWAEFTAHLLEKNAIRSALDFRNWSGWFPGIGYHERFTLLTLRENHEADSMMFGYYLDEPSQIRDPQKTFSISRQEAVAFNPITKAVPAFESIEAKNLLVYLYKRFPILSAPESGWKAHYSRGLDMTVEADKLRSLEDLIAQKDSLSPDSLLDSTATGYVRLCEGKLFHQLDHRFASFEGIPQPKRLGVKAATKTPTESQKRNPHYRITPRYWISVEDWKHDTTNRKLNAHWAIAFRHTTNVISNARTSIATVCSEVAFNYQAPNIVLETEDRAVTSLMFIAMMSSFAFDYVVRQKFFGANFIKSILYQLAVPALHRVVSQREFIFNRAFELTYTAWDLEPFAQECGWHGPPFRWDEERRFLLRCELDAAFFHLYLGPEEEWHRQETLTRFFPTPRHAVDYIMDSFPIGKRRDEEKHGDYRTKRVILEIYDEMAEAIRTGKPYRTRLDPPPGPPTDGQGNFLPPPELKPGQPKPENWPSHIHPPKGFEMEHIRDSKTGSREAEGKGATHDV